MNWPTHHGAMATRIRSHDWTTTCLGPIHTWPQSLRAAVEIVLQMSLPAILCWGRHAIVIANDTCSALSPGRDKQRTGCVLEDSWPDCPAFRDGIYLARNGCASFERDVQLEVGSKGSTRTAWFSRSYSPLHDETGQVAGALAVFVETTDRVLAEASLRESEHQLSAIFTHAQVGLSLLSLEGKFLRVNDSLCRMLDRPREALVGSSVMDITYAGDVEQTRHTFGKVIATGEPQSIDKRYVRPDGEYVWANSSISGLENGPGRTFTILAVTVDLTARKLAQDALADSEAKFRALAEASSALIWQLDEKGSAIYINPRHEVLLGIPPDQLLGYRWAFIVHPDDRAAAMDAMRNAVATQQPTQRRVRIRFVDGAWHWMEAHAAPWFTATGDYAGHVGIALDIDDAVRAQEDLLISNERLKLAIEGSGDGIWDWDLASNQIVYSPRAMHILCLSEPQPDDPFLGIERHVHADDIGLLRAELQACIDGTRPAFRMEYRVRTVDGGWRWVQARATVVARHMHTQLPQRMTGTITDISEKRRSEQVVWEHANFDLLTGLPNRRLFRDRLDHEICKAQRTGLPLALLFIDLDRFKESNDLLGHTIGDDVLVEAASRIRNCVRQSDTVARLGGDEFTAILTELDGGMHVERVAQKINETLCRPFTLGNEVAYLSASIGITLYPNDALDAENLIRNADQAMYVVKSQGRNHFSYFTPSMQHEANERLHLISDLRNALSRKQLRVHYQPIIDLMSGRLVKAEALLRWQHPTRGMIEPLRFIGFAEETGLISEIGDWVFRQAARCSRQWGKHTGAPFPVSINKSPVQFVSRLNEINWPDYLRELGLTGSSVSVEITEGLLLDASPVVTAKLLHYHNAGIKVAIDDFGTGYSSIAYLKKFSVDYLKIDQSFVRDIAFDMSDRAIVRSIIAMAHELGLEVIAEGIETLEQKKLLVDGQCDFGQGFLFSKAVPADEFERLLCASVRA
ncbi:EAL domain-containing protein [Massilia sp. TSP1-1-2]|uniref:EAL domain-containing protein n=1 Tax=Massilia sp. TSP1-1-2 TaxID=2804649 RepID=UPI003CEB8F2D